MTNKSADMTDRKVVAHAKYIIPIHKWTGNSQSYIKMLYESHKNLIAIAERSLEPKTCEGCSKQDDCEILNLIYGNSDFEDRFDSEDFACNYHEPKA